METIFLDFYNYFENKIKLNEKEQRRKEEISDIAKNGTIFQEMREKIY